MTKLEVIDPADQLLAFAVVLIMLGELRLGVANIEHPASWYGVSRIKAVETVRQKMLDKEAEDVLAAYDI